MVPSHKWFPMSLQDRAGWFQNFSDKFTILAVALGFTAADALAVADDNKAVQFLAKLAVDIDTFSKAMTAFRNETLEGPIGHPIPTLPTVPDLSNPHLAFPGLWERLDDLVKRIRVAPGYSNEEGQELGIVPASSGNGKNSLDNESPTLKARALPANAVEVSFVRGAASGISVEMKLDNEPDWKPAAIFTKSPGDFVVPSVNGNLPRAVALRARFTQDNKPIGLVSDVVNVVTTP